MPTDKPIKSIRDWKVISFAGAGYRLQGKPVNDSRFPDEDKWIYTSLLLSVNYIEMTAETSHTIYSLLGPEYSD